MDRVLREVKGVSVAFGGQHHSAWLPEGATIPPPMPSRTAILDIQIIQQDGGFMTVWESQNTQDSSDGWYLTLEDALQAAERLFGIPSGAWVVIADLANLSLVK